MMAGTPERENFPTFQSVWDTGTGKDGSQRKLDKKSINDSSSQSSSDSQDKNSKDGKNSDDDDSKKTNRYSLFSPGISARALWSVSAPDLSSDEIVEAWKCEECGHENYHENAGECECCGTGICFMDERKNNLASIERQLFVEEYGVDDHNHDDDQVSPIKSPKTSSLRVLLSRHPSFQNKSKTREGDSIISYSSAATTPTANLSPASAFSPASLSPRSSAEKATGPEVRVINSCTSVESQEEGMTSFNKAFREEAVDIEKSRRDLRSCIWLSPPVLVFLIAMTITTIGLWIPLHKKPVALDEGPSISSVMDGLWVAQGEPVFGDEPDYRSGASVALASGGSVMAVGVGKFGPVRAYSLHNEAGWLQRGQDISIGDGPKHVALSRKYGRTMAIASESDGSVAVFAYDKVNDEWAPRGEPLLFGVTNREDARASVSLSDAGKVLAVGVPSEGSLRSDSVRIVGYNRETNGWDQIGQNVVLDAETRIQHGGSVSLSSNGMVLAVGSWSEGATRSSYSSHAEVYRFFNSTWQQVGGKTNIGSRMSPEKSEVSVSLSGDGNIVGIGSGFRCRIFQYIKEKDKWSQLGQDLVGKTVSLSTEGNVLAVGNPESDDKGSNSGEAVIYAFDEGTESWEQVGDSIPGEVQGDSFGAALSLSEDGKRVAVGAPGSGASAENSGSVSVFKLE
jgi:hypothetical protein